MADDSKQPQPTSSEALFFYSIVKNMKAISDIDWNAVAEDRGFKNAEVAKVRFGQVKRKLGIASEGAKSTPKKIAKTPGSRSGTKGKGGGRAKKEESHDEDNMDDTPTKSKHQPKHEDGDVKDEVKEEGKTLQEQVDDMIAGHPF